MRNHKTSLQNGRRSADYAVGYGKPPAATRFQPGQSGNPKGRPKGGETIRTAICKVMAEPIVISEGGRKRRMSALEAVFRGQRTEALKGNVKAAGFVVGHLHMAQIEDPDPDPDADEPPPPDDFDLRECFAQYLAGKSGEDQARILKALSELDRESLQATGERLADLVVQVMMGRKGFGDR